MVIESIREFIKDKAEEFGAKIDNEYNKPYIERNNSNQEALKDNGAYFGFIHPEEETSGPYHDFSLTIFPSSNEKPWLVCLGIGSSGFKNDYELATYPGVRRLFSKLVNENGFCKSDFSDIESNLPKSLTGNFDLQHLKNTIKIYSKVLPVCQIVKNPESEKGKAIISAFVAAYAKLRDWPTNQKHRNAITQTLEPFFEENEINNLDKINKLLLERKFIVLQGPPGTGKTRAAKEISNQIKAKTFFTQFHAETTFSDFIYGIRPNLKNTELTYIEKLGDFSKALNYAVKNPQEKIILIIDEINRANLSNVLGPIFYLFEPKMENSKIEIEIFPDFKINKLPANFFVIATMNTADRSLAVVDFALRRRFAWYDLIPKSINGKPQKITARRVKNGQEKETQIQVLKFNNDQMFFMEDFTQFQEIFNWYATSNELALQPGQGYFIASSEEEMKNRIMYELFPLIKEYLNEGLIKNAKEEFNNYFSTRINRSLFE